jgi:rhodanese-related sulfurtransferase
MEVLTRERIEQEGLPEGAHVLEMVGDRDECQRHAHFAGMECLPLADIKEVRTHYDPASPIIVHCERPERCTLAAEELSRFGFTNVYHYDGELRDLETWVKAHGAAGEFEAPLISAAALESLLKARGHDVQLLDLHTEETRCERMLGITCLEPYQIEDELKDRDRGDTIVFRCAEGISNRDIAKALYEMGFRDVRLFQGSYSEISWIRRL